MQGKISTLRTDSAFDTLVADTAAECLSLLDGVTGSHALLLDAVGGAIPQLPGIGRWTALRYTSADGPLRGPLHAQPDALPFAEGSFSLVWVRHLVGAGAPLGVLTGEIMRVLASHGLLLAEEFHPCSLWRPWLARKRQGGETSLRAFWPSRWRRCLIAEGLGIRDYRRCGAPWPRSGGTTGLPHWIAGFAGPVYLLKARKRDTHAVVRRLTPKRTRSARERAPWAPGAQRTKT